MSDLTLFNNKEQGIDGFKYYNIPVNYPLFKATKTFFDDKRTLTLQPNKLYFFGIKDITPSYIEDYEELYGVIFEFKTTKHLRLLALDDPDTMSQLYENAPSNIKIILERNYGYFTGIRDSVPGPDDEFSKYICSLDKQGYSIFNMATDMGGRFHPEFMICNATNSVELVGQITTEPNVNSILRKADITRHAETMKAARRTGKTTKSSQPRRTGAVGRLFMDDDDDGVKPIVPKMGNTGSPGKRLFMDDDDDDEAYNDISSRSPGKRLSMDNTGGTRRLRNRMRKTKKMRRSRGVKRSRRVRMNIRRR